MLPNGIISFRDLNGPYFPEQEIKVFKEFCYSIALLYHCTLVSFDSDLASKNFYSAEIKIGSGNLYLLENAYYPWMAFAKNWDFAGIDFIESPFNLTDQNIHVLTL